MYKVLIVDDEMIVRVGLKSFIHWEQYGFTVVGEANNGEEALELADKLRPDLILTDIKMPKMGGIDLIRHALERWKEMKIVVLSCVNEFDILQQAMRYGVKDYFLKLTFNPDDLIEILNKIRAELDQRKKPAVSGISVGDTGVGMALKENYYRIAVRDKAGKLKPDPHVQLRIGASSRQTVFYIRRDRPYSRNYNDPKLRGHLLKYSVTNIIAEVLEREVPSDVVELEEDLYLAIADSAFHENRTMAFLLADEIQQSLQRFLNYSVSIGISQPADCFHSFYDAYQQSQKAYGGKFYEGHRSVHEYEPNASVLYRPGQHLLTVEEEHALQEELDMFQFEKARDRGIRLIEQVREQRNWPADAFKSSFTELVLPWFRMYKRYGGMLNEGSHEKLHSFYQIRDLETLEDVRDWYLDYTAELEESIRILSKGLRVREEIEKAKKYVEKFFPNEISIVDVAHHVGLNSAYFSHLFKKETGEGFSEYLTRVRLSHAQRLLRDSTKTIAEIAEEVGYRDVAYFRKIFRQQFSMTPTDYRTFVQGRVSPA